MIKKANFNDWLNSDNVIRTEKGYYKTHCDFYRKEYKTVLDLKAYFKKEYQS
jgi:hypothetical protein